MDRLMMKGIYLLSFDHNVGKQGLLCTGVANPPVNNKIKCVTQLKESGLWGNDTALPVMAFESIQVEIELEDAVKVLKRQMPCFI